jgi:hypothetical protein
VSEPRPPVGCSPRVRPFPPRPPPEVAFLCSIASSVLRPHPTSHPRTCSAYGYCLPEPARHKSGHGTRSPTARGSSHASQFAMGRCCLLVSELDRHLGIRPVSQLNTWPAVSPVNASRLPSRAEHSCITRGRGGWLNLPRGGLSPPILCQLPGALGVGSRREELKSANVLCCTLVTGSRRRS